MSFERLSSLHVNEKKHLFSERVKGFFLPFALVLLATGCPGERSPEEQRRVDDIEVRIKGDVDNLSSKIMDSGLGSVAVEVSEDVCAASANLERRAIRFNPDFYESIEKGAQYLVILHEYGHIINGKKCSDDYAHKYAISKLMDLYGEAFAVKAFDSLQNFRKQWGSCTSSRESMGCDKD